jgi:hypothetical protein
MTFTNPDALDCSDNLRAKMNVTIRDRILYWPIVLAVIFPAACFFAWAGRSFLPPLFPAGVLMLWGAAIAFSLIMCAVWLFERDWHRLVSTLVLPLTVVAAILGLDFVWPGGQRAFDYIHLFASYPYYAAEISQLTGDAPRFHVWEWSGVGPCISGIAYDDRDELAPSMPPKVWGGRFDGLSVSGEARAFGHYYFVDICPQPEGNANRPF